MVETKTMLLKMRSKMLIEEVALAVVDYFLRDIGREGCREMGRKVKLRFLCAQGVGSGESS